MPIFRSQFTVNCEAQPTNCPSSLQFSPAVPAVHITFLRSFFHVSFGRPVSLWTCDVYCGVCLVILSSLLLSVCSSQLHNPFSSFQLVHRWLVVIFLHHSSIIVSSHCMFTILLNVLWWNLTVCQPPGTFKSGLPTYWS